MARDVEWDGVPANAGVRTFDAHGKLRSRLAVRAIAERVTRGCGRRARPHGPAVRLARRSGGAHPSRAARALVHALARRADPARRDEALSMSSSASTARAFHSPLRRCGGRAMRSTSSAFRRRRCKTATGRCDFWHSGARRVGRGSRRCFEAVSLAVAGGTDVRLEIRGPSLTDDERAHRLELERLVADDDSLRGRVEVLPPVPRLRSPRSSASADVVVSPNEPRSGATLDKAVFEAAACGRPVLSTNRRLRATARRPGPAPARPGPRSRGAGGGDQGAERRRGHDARTHRGSSYARRVVAGHSLDHWADTVIDVLREIRSPRGKAGSERAHG